MAGRKTKRDGNEKNEEVEIDWVIEFFILFLSGDYGSDRGPRGLVERLYSVVRFKNGFIFFKKFITMFNIFPEKYFNIKNNLENKYKIVLAH